MTRKRIVCTIQAIYYLATGIWPLVHVESFQAVTGPKTDNWTGLEADHWLLNTVAVLVVAIGLALAVAAWRGQVRAETIVLAVGSAIGLLGIDLVYVARGVIARVYLLDAAAEILLLIAWAWALLSTRGDRKGIVKSGTVSDMGS
jgi:hypothetical protein